MTFLRIEVDGQPRITAALKALDDALDTTQILDEGSAILLHHTISRYLQQVDPDGVAWLPSKAAQKRAQLGRGGGTLFRTGRLWSSIQLFAVDDNSRAIGTDVPYAGYAQNGPPTRQYLGFGEEDVNLMHQLIIKRVSEALNGFA